MDEDNIKIRMELIIRENEDVKRQLLAHRADMDILNMELMQNDEANSILGSEYEKSIKQKKKITRLKNELMEYKVTTAQFLGKLQSSQKTIKQLREKINTLEIVLKRKCEQVTILEADNERIKVKTIIKIFFQIRQFYL